MQAMNFMQYLWKCMSKWMKLEMLRTCVFLVATCGCEERALRKLDANVLPIYMKFTFGHFNKVSISHIGV